MSQGLQSAAVGDVRPARTGFGWLNRLPPQAFFLVSAVFHYLGPSFAVLLFARVDVLGVLWLRIATAAAVFAVWRRPWRLALRLDPRARWVLIQLGVVLAAMNTVFYLAVDRLPLSTVGGIEFLGTVLLAAWGVRTKRNVIALVLTTSGVGTMAQLRLVAEPLGFAFSFANCALFLLYVILGHRIANSGTAGGRRMSSAIDRLGASMLVAAVAITPVGLGRALPALTDPSLLLAGAAVGLCSSVIPYVVDQLAMARLPRASFALMLALLPMFATLIGAIVLRQIPTLQEVVGVTLVMAGVALHQVSTGERKRKCTT